MSPYYRDGNGGGKAGGYFHAKKLQRRCRNRNFFPVPALYPEGGILPDGGKAMNRRSLLALVAVILASLAVMDLVLA